MLSYPEVMRIAKAWSIRQRKAQLVNLTLLVSGILVCRSGSLPTIERSWTESSNHHIHRLKRLHRFLKNKAVNGEPIFRAAAADLWPQWPAGQRIRLVLLP